MSTRRSRRGNFVKGRAWLVVIFLLLCGLNCLTYFAAAHKREVMGPIINSSLWSVVLLAAIWCRKNWARYAMVILMLVSVALAFILEASFAEFVAGDTLLIMVTITAGHLVVALILIFSHGIQKLTSNAYV
jgi:NADH:ubiquinone oxidoreductase subunit K